jgi:hypothetical protein
MTKLNPWNFGAVLSITVVINYILCATFWFAFTEPAIKFLSILFHGMDFTKIYASTAFAWRFPVYAYRVSGVGLYSRSNLCCSAQFSHRAH